MKNTRQKTVNRAATMQPAASPIAVAVKRGYCVQASAKVSSPHDQAEKEADATARKIIRMPVSPFPKRGMLHPPLEKGGRGDLKDRRGFPTPPEGISNEPPPLSGGQPLPLNIRRFMEPRFRADFRNVKIHTGDKSAKLNRQLNAQAFTIGNHIFFGKERFQPESNEGKELIAHELTHTVQQGAVIQRAEDVSIILQSPQMAPHKIQRLGISDALNYFADKANLIPGFRMFTIILSVNPVNMSRVDRSAANILRAVIEFIPGGGLITQALDNHGVFDKVGNWVEQQIRSLGMTGSVIKEAIFTFLDSLGWRDIFDLSGVWNRAKRIFTGPIDRIINFVKGLVTGIIKFIKDAILRPLAKLAEGTRGYDLLKAVLGEDPVTGEPVPRNAETLIGGFMKLIGQEEVWENLKKSNAVARAWAWFQSALSSLIGFVRQIPTMFLNAFKSLEIADIVLLPRAFAKVAAVFGNFIGSFLSWAGNAVWNLLEIIFAVVAPGVIPYLKKAAGAFKTILKNPVVFIGNLVRAGKSGFQQFADKIGTHLKTSLIQWLTGTLGGAGVYIPQSFDLREIIKFVLSVLGLTWQNIRQKLVRVVGETVVKAMETGFDIVVTLVTQGPAAAWEKIKEQLTNLKEMVMEEIMSFVTSKIVQSAITKLISMLTPAGAVIQAIIAIYNTIMFFIERLKQIAQVAAAFIDSISAIAGGVITAAANRVEQTLAGLLTLAISFLARFAGLGKVSDAVINIVNKIRAPVDKALDKVVDWIVSAAKKMGRFIAGTAQDIFEWWKERQSFSNKDGESHTLLFQGSGQSARLMIASSPNPAENYLSEYQDKDSSDFKTAKSVFEDSKKVIFSPARPDENERERRIMIKNELIKISLAFAKLAGDPPKGDDYPKTIDPDYSGPPATKNSVEYIVGSPKTGSTPPKGKDTGTPGWKDVVEAGLTKISDKWVQMHVVSGQLGGKGQSNNLISAPNSINTGHFRSFEHSVKNMAKSSNRNIKNVIWLNVSVNYHDATYAKSISGRAGLYFWKGKKSPQKWIKNEEPSLTASANIPRPDLHKNKKYSLNFSSGTDLAKVINDGKLIGLIKSNRYYSSLENFRNKMAHAYANQGVTGYNQKINTVVTNPKIILNDVEE